MVLTTETLITDLPEKEKAGAGGGHDHGGRDGLLVPTPDHTAPGNAGGLRSPRQPPGRFGASAADHQRPSSRPPDCASRHPRKSTASTVLNRRTVAVSRLVDTRGHRTSPAATRKRLWSRLRLPAVDNVERSPSLRVTVTIDVDGSRATLVDGVRRHDPGIAVTDLCDIVINERRSAKLESGPRGVRARVRSSRRA